MAAVETAKPFDTTPIASSLEFRKRNRIVPDFVDAAWGSTSLKVTASGGTSINIANGRAVIQGALYELTSGPMNLAVAANGGGSNRTDYAVLTYDSAHDPGVYSRVLTGTALTRADTGVWDCPIATWQKTPAGAIVNLVDMRPLRGAPVLPCLSTARPQLPTMGQLAYEVDTDRYIRWNGSTWDVLLEDTGWVDMAVPWPTAWNKVATTAARRKNGVVYLTLQLQRVGSAYPKSDADGTILAQLPAGMRPTHHFEYFTGQFTAGITIRIGIHADGTIVADDPDKDVPNGSFLRFSCSFAI